MSAWARKRVGAREVFCCSLALMIMVHCGGSSDEARGRNPARAGAGSGASSSSGTEGQGGRGGQPNGGVGGADDGDAGGEPAGGSSGNGEGGERTGGASGMSTAARTGGGTRGGGDGPMGGSGPSGGNGPSGAGEGGFGAGGGDGPEGDDPCELNPCTRPGACVSSGSTYTCQCPYGLGGENCSTDLGLRVVSISHSNFHRCAVMSDGTLNCIGADGFGQSSAPPGRFTQVKAAGSHTCALRVDGKLVCFGNLPESFIQPDGEFLQVGGIGYGICAIRTDRSVACWPGALSPSLVAPLGQFLRISMSDHSPTVLTPLGDVEYFSGSPFAWRPMNIGPFADISSEGSTLEACGLRTDGTVTCWGIVSPSGRFRMIATTYNAWACGIRMDDSIACWDRDATHESYYPGEFRDLSLSEDVTCAVRTDGSAGCNRNEAPLPAPQIPASALASAEESLCTLSPSGQARCWYGDRSDVISGSFRQIAANYSSRRTICGVTTDGRAWSDTNDAPTGEFTSVSAGPDYCCGIKADRSIACWDTGYVPNSLPGAAPSGSFLKVAAGADHVCGIRYNRRLACWGRNDDGRASPPAGSYVELAAGANHTCAIRSDGTVACWGSNEHGESNAPFGHFSKLSAHGSHTCAIRTDGTLRCWGSNAHGESSPPLGRFNDVAAGAHFTCAIAENSAVNCWGLQSYGFSPDFL
jgi:hypothetical protein